MKNLFNVKSSLVYRLFYPQVPVILCSRYSGKIAGMPANSCMPVSDSPPLVAIAIKLDSRTSGIVSKSGMLSLNWLDFKSVTIVERLASPYKSDRPDKLASLNIKYRVLNGVPTLLESRAFAICRVIRKLTTGDHALFVCRVLSAEASGDFSKRYWQFKKYRPILYLGSDKLEQYATL